MAEVASPAWLPLARPERAGGDLYVGTSGWQYKAWSGAFYPRDLPTRGHLGWYAERFPSVEVNATFYRLPTRETLARWRDAVPDGFLFAIKASRFVTHRKKLLDADEHLPKLTRLLPALGDRLGPILVQLPPRWNLDLARLRAFVDVLDPDLRWALEFRDPRWYAPEALDLLREANVALVLHDHPDAPSPKAELTAEWTYLRFHGIPGELYGGAYTGRRLRPWAERAHGWLDEGRDVFAYFNNDRHVGAPQDARWLLERAR